MAKPLHELTWSRALWAQEEVRMPEFFLHLLNAVSSQGEQIPMDVQHLPVGFCHCKNVPGQAKSWPRLPSFAKSTGIVRIS
jgi:hypothetical protein